MVNGLWREKDRQTSCSYCCIQRTEDVNPLLMAFQLHGGLVSPCDVADTFDGLKDSVIYSHAHSKGFNVRISWQLLLPWKIHLSDVQQRTVVHREVLYPCSFSMVCTCSWTATVSSPLRIFCSTNALIQSLFWRGSLSQVFWQCCQFPDTVIHSLYLEQLWHLSKVWLQTVLTLSSTHNQCTKSIRYARVYAECTPTVRTWVNAYYISSTGTVRKLFIDRNCKCSFKQNFSNYHSTHIKEQVVSWVQLSYHAHTVYHTLL